MEEGVSVSRKKWYLILNTLLVKEYITVEKLSDITQTTSQTLKRILNY